MAVTNFTPLLGLALPTTGDLSGTWGATVNDAITDLLDDAVAGTVGLTTDANVTLTTTNGADNQARNAIILCTGARTALRTITAPAQSKLYVIINATTGGFGVKIVGAGPTTGITVLAGTQVMVAWNGTDFVVSSGDLVGPSSATDNAITRFDLATGKLVQNSLVTIADDGAITAPQVGSVIPFYYANQAAFPSASTYHGALAHSHADGAMFFAHSSVWVRLLDDSTDVTVAQGGTGLSTLTANNVIIGNGTSAPLFVAPSTSGNVLTSNGTTWLSSVPAAGGISYTSVKTANYTAVNNDGVLTNTTGGGFTVTFPASPSVGNQIVVVDAFSQWGTNNLIVDPTGSQRIAGGTLGDTLTLDITGATVTFVYSGSAYGWSVFAQVGGNSGTVVTLTGVQTLTNKTIAFGSNTLTDVAGVTATQTLTNKTIAFGSNTLTGVANTSAAQTFTGGQRGAVTALTSTSNSIAINLADNCNFSYTTVQDSTLAAPSNPVAGQSGVIVITQGATPRLLAYNTFYKFAGGTVPTLTATASAVDTFAYYVESATRATCQLIKDVK